MAELDDFLKELNSQNGPCFQVDPHGRIWKRAKDTNSWNMYEEEAVKK